MFHPKHSISCGGYAFFDVCNFDAIVMTHEHEESGISRDGSRMDLSGLLEIGGRYQTQTGWQPSSKD